MYMKVLYYFLFLFYLNKNCTHLSDSSETAIVVPNCFYFSQKIVINITSARKICVMYIHLECFLSFICMRFKFHPDFKYILTILRLATKTDETVSTCDHSILSREISHKTIKSPSNLFLHKAFK